MNYLQSPSVYRPQVLTPMGATTFADVKRTAFSFLLLGGAIWLAFKLAPKTQRKRSNR